MRELGGDEILFIKKRELHGFNFRVALSFLLYIFLNNSKREYRENDFHLSAAGRKRGEKCLVFERQVHLKFSVCLFCFVIRERGMCGKICNICVRGQVEQGSLTYSFFDALFNANAVFLQYVC